MDVRRQKLIAAVVHELVKLEQFATLADLTDAVKCRCSRLRIGYDGALVSAAIDLVTRTRPVLVADSSALIGRQPTIPPLPRAEAARLYRTLMSRFNAERDVHDNDRAGWPEHFPRLVRVPEWM